MLITLVAVQPHELRAATRGGDTGATPSPTAVPAFVTAGTDRDTSSPIVVGLDNPLSKYRESREVRLRGTPFEDR